MTDLALTAPDAVPRPSGSKRRKLLLALPAVAALAGAGASYMGLISPMAMIGFGSPAARDEAPRSAFVDLPPINVTLPDVEPRMLHLAVKLETDEASRAEVEHLLPRVTDSYNTFLTGIAPAAFQRRGILEIVRAELVTRARQAIGPAHRVDVMITEFALK